MISIKFLLAFFLLPILASFLLDKIFEKPQLDHGKGSMFDLIANRYDFINRVLALNMDTGWREVMVDEVVSHGKLFEIGMGGMEDTTSTTEDKQIIHILDLATGTADVAILLAKKYNENKSQTKKKDIQILGIDPSQNMIDVGKEKVGHEQLSDVVTLTIGDARHLHTLSNDHFHAATMAFGIRNIPERDVALCEIHRVLKKHNDTRLAILEFSEPDEEALIMGSLARLFIRYVVPVVGAILSGAPKEYMHLQNSIKEFPSPREFVSLLEGVQCHYDDSKEGIATFNVIDVIQLNFGSVQLYVTTPVYI